ncbi:hypothetical protein STEG23_032472, partial [Scotinomys teguina]
MAYDKIPLHNPNDLESMILLPQLPECWSALCTLPSPASTIAVKTRFQVTSGGTDAVVLLHNRNYQVPAVLSSILYRFSTPVIVRLCVTHGDRTRKLVFQR